LRHLFSIREYDITHHHSIDHHSNAALASLFDYNLSKEKVERLVREREPGWKVYLLFRSVFVKELDPKEWIAAGGSHMFSIMYLMEFALKSAACPPIYRRPFT